MKGPKLAQEEFGVNEKTKKDPIWKQNHLTREKPLRAQAFGTPGGHRPQDGTPSCRPLMETYTRDKRQCQRQDGNSGGRGDGAGLRRWPPLPKRPPRGPFPSRPRSKPCVLLPRGELQVAMRHPRGASLLLTGKREATLGSESERRERHGGQAQAYAHAHAQALPCTEHKGHDYDQHFTL